MASAVPPAGGSQGTGQDLQRGGEVPVTLLPRRAGGGRAREASACGSPSSGKVRFLSPPRHGPGLGAGPPTLRGAGRLQRGVLAPPAAQLRPGPLHRLREPGRVPRHRPGRRGRPGRAARDRHPVPARGHGAPRSPSRSRRAPTPSSRPSPARPGRSSCPASRPTRSPTPSSGVLAARRAADHRRAQGQRDRRSTPGPPSSASPPAGSVARGRAGHPTPQPPPRGAAPRPRPRLGRGRGCCEPTNGRRSTAPAASRSPSGTSAHVARRRPRTRKRVRHEKGSPR